MNHGVWSLAVPFLESSDEAQADTRLSPYVVPLSSMLNSSGRKKKWDQDLGMSSRRINLAYSISAGVLGGFIEGIAGFSAANCTMTLLYSEIFVFYFLILAQVIAPRYGIRRTVLCHAKVE